MRVHFTDQGWDEYRHWMTIDQTMLERVNRLIEVAGEVLAQVGVGDVVHHHPGSKYTNLYSNGHQSKSRPDRRRFSSASAKQALQSSK